MSDGIALISSAIVTEAELADFIIGAGGSVEPGTPLFGRFSDGWRHVWIGLSPSDLEAAIKDAGPEYLAQLTVLLGGPPRTDVVVEISRTEGSERLALDFAFLFGATWPAVVVDPRGGLLTRNDLLRCQATGQDIRHATASVPQAAHGGRHPEAA